MSKRFTEAEIADKPVSDAAGWTGVTARSSKKRASTSPYTPLFALYAPKPKSRRRLPIAETMNGIRIGAAQQLAIARAGLAVSPGGPPTALCGPGCTRDAIHGPNHVSAHREARNSGTCRCAR